MQGQWGVTVCYFPLSSLSPFEKSHVDGGSGHLGFWSGNPPSPPPPPPRPLVCLREKLNLDASLDIGVLSELHQSDGERRSRCGNSSLGLWHEH